MKTKSNWETRGLIIFLLVVIALLMIWSVKDINQESKQLRQDCANASFQAIYANKACIATVNGESFIIKEFIHTEGQ